MSSKSHCQYTYTQLTWGTLAGNKLQARGNCLRIRPTRIPLPPIAATISTHIEKTWMCTLQYHKATRCNGNHMWMVLLGLANGAAATATIGKYKYEMRLLIHSITSTMPPYVLDFLMTTLPRGGSTSEHLKELCILDVEAPQNPLYYIFRLLPPTTTTTTTDAAASVNDSDGDNDTLQWWEGKSRYCHNCVMFHIKEAYPNTWSSSIFYVREEKLTLARDLFPELPIWGTKSLSSSSSSSSHNITCLFREHDPNCAYILCMRLYDSLCCD